MDLSRRFFFKVKLMAFSPLPAPFRFWHGPEERNDLALLKGRGRLATVEVDFDPLHDGLPDRRGRDAIPHAARGRARIV
jgi:hypothetical protein